MFAIEATGLRKTYGGHTVLDGIDLRVEQGSVYALLGPNGAGKSTTVHILSTLLAPDAGQVRVAGHDLATDADGVRASIGLTGQVSAVDGLLTGAENLRLMGDLRHLGRARSRAVSRELLERFDLVDAAARPAATWSGGMRRRLDLAMTLVGGPSVLYLDEPTTGLDPRSRRTMWAIVRELVAGGVTVLLTTQYLEEADQLADRVGVLDRGRIVAEGTPAELKRQVPGGHLVLRLPDLAAVAATLAAVAGDVRGEEDELTVHVPCDGSPAAIKAVLDRLSDRAVVVDELAVHTPDLDDVFLALTGARQEAMTP